MSEEIAARRAEIESENARAERFAQEFRLAKKQRYENARVTKPRLMSNQKRPMNASTPLPASADDGDSAEAILALARRTGLPGLRKPAHAEEPSPSPKADAEAPDEDAKTEAILALARRAGLPGLRKR